MKTEIQYIFGKNQFSNINFSRLFIIAIFVLISFSSFTNKPAINNNEISLFKIERNRDGNEVIYNVKITESGIRQCKHPLHVFWQINSKNNKTKSLTLLQNKFGYGVVVTKELKNEIHFTIAALPSQGFMVKKTESGRIKAFTNINGKEIIVNSIYISFVEGTNWTAEISYVQLNGTSADTNKKIKEFIQP